MMENNSKGKIMRVKQGYNPNSSSMGSIVFALPTALLGITAGFGIVSGIITSAFMKNKNESKLKEGRTSAQSPNREDSIKTEGQ
jgi:hypothetical protein